MRTPFTTNEKFTPQKGEQGFGYYGLIQTDGMVPEPHDPTLYDIEEMLLDDAQATALDRVLTFPIRRNGFDIEDAKGGKTQGDFARQVLLDEEAGMKTPMRLVISQMTTAPSNGFAAFEKVWNKQTGSGGVLRWGYEKVAFRPAKTVRMRLDRHGAQNGFWQIPGNSILFQATNTQKVDRIYFPPVKAFVYLHDEHMNPGHGRTVYGPAYNRWLHKKKVESMLFTALSRFAGGIKKVSYDGTAQAGGDPQGIVQRLFDRARQLRGSGTIGVGPGEDMDLMSLSNVSQEFREVLLYLNSEMARSVLAHFLMLGSEANVGSWALSKDQSDFFLMALEAIMREMESAINNYLITPLIRANFGVAGASAGKIPRFRFRELDTETKLLSQETWANLALSGVWPMNPTIGNAMEVKATQAMGIPAEAWTPQNVTKEDLAVGPQGTVGNPAIKQKNGLNDNNNPQGNNQNSVSQGRNATGIYNQPTRPRTTFKFPGLG